MNKILWVSRKHLPTNAQKEDLQRIFGGDVAIIPYTKTFDSAEEIASVYRKENCVALVYVGPDSVLRRLVAMKNVVVVRATPRPARKGEERDFKDRKGEPIVFDGFERVDSYTFETTRL